jgi:hypothetical protein
MSGGSLVWVDRFYDAWLVVTSDREFGRWALEVWPAFSDDVLRALGPWVGAVLSPRRGPAGAAS